MLGRITVFASMRATLSSHKRSVLWGVALVSLLAFQGASAASPRLADENSIILPSDGQVVVRFVSVSASCTGAFGLHSPEEILIFPNYKYYAGLPFPLPDYYAEGTNLVFYITPGDFCAGSTYLSTDPARAIITHPDPYTWRIAWEDYNDGDFNDLIVQVKLQPSEMPFLDLPYDYTGSSFADESKDTEQDGTVNAYFDHQYPTYCKLPNVDGCSATDTKAVNFRGYDGDPAVKDQPPYNVVYNGHDGIDYRLLHNTAVLAAAEGVITFSDVITQGCDVNGPSKTIIISHPNGYETQYWHLDHFADGMEVGAEVSRDADNPIGYVGKTGCVTGYHLHFVVKNPDGVVVDPYGWDPLPDAAWYGQTDPWQQYNADLQDPIDATSHYLWVHPLETVVLVAPTTPTVIASASGEVTATIPAGAYDSPLRIELAESLQPARIPGYASLLSFSLFGYTLENVPVTTLKTAATIDVQVSLPESRALAASSTMTPTLHVWDPDTSTWSSLSTSWDPANGHATAASAKIGTFSLSRRLASIHLPLICRDAR